MKVKVRNYMWRVVEIEVDLGTDTVMCLKEKIEQEEGTEIEKQVLYLDREVMENMRRLDEYGVREGSLILIKAPPLSCSCHARSFVDLSGNCINKTNE